MERYPQWQNIRTNFVSIGEIQYKVYLFVKVRAALARRGVQQEYNVSFVMCAIWNLKQLNRTI